MCDLFFKATKKTITFVLFNFVYHSNFEAMYFDTISDLKNAFPTTLPPNGEYIVGGYFAVGDGGGGTFVWVLTSPTLPPADDGGIIIQLDSNASYHNSGYFKRIYSGSINVRWFGAIMGATDPNPTPHTITDVTQYVHKARDSQFAKDGGTLYFSKGVYAGAFVISHVDGEVNIIGDGDGTVLLASGNTSVLTLGYRNQFWRYSKVSNLTIDGQSKNADGVTFSDSDQPHYPGRWNFENVTIRNCKKGIYKPKGNIGNSYTNCFITDNDFGYYAVDFSDMHAGCEIFKGGQIAGNSHAAMYVGVDYFYGQVIIDGTIIEGNPGFGIYLRLRSAGRMMFTPMEIRNVWVEGNAIPIFSVNLERSSVVPSFTPPQPPPALNTISASAYYNPTTNNLILSFDFDFTGTGDLVTGGGVYFGPAGSPLGTLIASISGSSTPSGKWSQAVQIPPAFHNDLFAGNICVQVETSSYPTGEFRGQLYPPSDIIIDGHTYAPEEIRTFHFEGARSVCFSSTQVIDIRLIDSSVNLLNCRSDKHFVGSNEWPYRVEVDEKSQIVATELLYGGSVSEDIFVNSISYDGTADIYNDPAIPTSVWGPLRNTLVKKVYETLPYNVKYGSLLGGTSPISFGAVKSVQVMGGVLGTLCAKLFIPPGVTATLNMGFSLAADKYYLWSVHALQDSDEIMGILHTLNDSHALGEVILKKNQWACTYGIKNFKTGTTDPVYLSLTNNSLINLGILYLADVQVVEFSNFADAVSFAQSRAFICKSIETITGPVHTASLANVYVGWDAERGSFETANDFNIAGVERVSAGIYDIRFVLPVENTPIVHLPPETIEAEDGSNIAVAATFENLSIDGIRVRLSQTVAGRQLPIDCPYSFSAQ